MLKVLLGTSILCFGFCSLALLGTLISADLSQTLEASKDQSPRRIAFFHDQFEIVKPKGWTPQHDLSEVAELQWANLDSGLNFIILTTPQIDFHEGLDLESFMEDQVEFFRSGLEEMEDLGPHAATHPRWNVMSHEFRTVMAGKPIHYRVDAIATEAHFHQFMYWAAPDDFAQNLAVLDGILSSFRETPTE